MNNTLKYYFPLDKFEPLKDENDKQVKNKSLVSSQVSEQKGELYGIPEIVHDDKLGLCLQFDGKTNYIDIPKASGLDNLEKLSIQLWVNLEDINGDQPFFSNVNMNVILGAQNDKFYCVISNQLVFKLESTPLQAKRWYHFTVVFTLQSMSIYMDGEHIATIKLTGVNEISLSAFQIGSYRGASNWGLFGGKIARLRIYSDALESNQISNRILDDLTATAAFNQVSPLSFQFLNEDDQAVLYITDAAAGEQNLRLEVRNASDQTITFWEDAAWHLRLNFHPGILRQIGLADGWENNLNQVQFKAPTNTTIEAGERWTIALPSFTAEPDGGTRGTLVELTHQKLKVSENEDDSYTDSHLLHLSLINHRGFKNLPLHAGFVGTNAIVIGETNNEVTNELTLRLSCFDQNGFTFQESNAPTTITLGFDLDETWALTTKDLADKIEVDIVNNLSKNFRVDKTSQNNLWKIITKESTVLEYEEYLDIKLSNIITSYSSGTTNLYLSFDHIPNHWDTKMVIPIEKKYLSTWESASQTGDNPIVRSVHFGKDGGDNLEFNDVKGPVLNSSSNVQVKINNDSAMTVNENGVGIGAVPNAPLDFGIRKGLAIKTETFSGESVYIGRTEENSIEFDFGQGTILNSTASLSFNIDSNNSDDNIRNIDFRAHAKGANKGDLLMRIQENGNVGIGTSDSVSLDAKFEVNGVTKLNHLNVESITAKSILVDSIYSNINGNLQLLKTVGHDRWAYWEAQTIQAGDIRIGGPSDIRLKKDISKIPNALDKIAGLNGVSFQWNQKALDTFTGGIEETMLAGPDATEEENKALWQKARQKAQEEFSAPQIGLIAQEVEAVLPELVSTNEEGYKGLEYDKMAALFVEAIKELKNEVQELKKEVKDLREKL